MDKEYMLPIGTKLNGGRYQVIEQLSSGGFGNTYKVKEVFKKHVYAMKEFFIRTINEREADGETVKVSNRENIDAFIHQKEKFLVEAERLRDIDNPNIVKVHDFFSDNETSYYVMDFIEGVSLDKRNEPLHEEDAWGILDQILDALEAVHQIKTVENGKERIWLHLDIKPANLMIDQGGKVTLIDFGASKQLSTDGNNSSLSLSQMPFTKGYAPLEQNSQRLDSIGPWTDFYALGATLYKLQTSADTQIPEYSELQDKINDGVDLAQAFHFPQDMSEKMRKLIVWMMNPDRKKRPKSVSDIRSYIQPDLKSDNHEEFTGFKHILTIETDPAGSGTVSINPMKEQYDDGESIVCEAKPKNGYQFQGWFNSQGEQVGDDAIYSFIIANNTKLTAKFKIDKKFFEEFYDVSIKMPMSKKALWSGIGAALFTLFSIFIFYTFFDYSIGLYGDISEDLVLIYKLENGQMPNRMGDVVKYGFMDKHGNIKIPLIYDGADDFHEGLAAVQKGKDGKWGFINKEGAVVIDFIYNDITSFHEGLAAVQIDEGGKWGYINKQGDIVIDFIYDDASNFSEGLALVTDNDGRRFIDRNGDIVLDEKAIIYADISTVQYVGSFHDGLARVRVLEKRNGEWDYYYGFINKDANLVIDIEYSDAKDFNNGVAKVRKEGGWELINKSNRLIIPFDSTLVFYAGCKMNADGLMPVGKKIERSDSNKLQKYKRYIGYFDKDGKEIIPFFEGEGGNFSNGLAHICKNGQDMYIDEYGETIIQCNYGKDYVYYGEFSNGHAVIISDNQATPSLIIDKSGNVIYNSENILTQISMRITNWYLEHFK